MQKYDLVGGAIPTNGHNKLHRIRAARDFDTVLGTVKKGTLGGYIENEGNLSHEGAAWIQDGARVYGNAAVSGDAQIYGNAQVYDNAQVLGDAQVYGYADIFGNARICDNARIYGNARIFGDAMVGGVAAFGTGMYIRGMYIRSGTHIDGSAPADKAAPAAPPPALTPSYTGQFKITPQLQLADLLRPCDSGKPNSPTPLMLANVWKDMAEVRQILATRNERLTTDLLRAATPDGKMTYLQTAITIGALDQVLTIAEESGQNLTAADFTTQDKNGIMPIQHIVAQKKLDRVFKAELWVCRTREIVEIWQKIPAADKTRPDLQAELSRVSVLSMRQRMAAKPPGAPPVPPSAPPPPTP